MFAGRRPLTVYEPEPLVRAMLVPATALQPVQPLGRTRMKTRPVFTPAYVTVPEMLKELNADVSKKFCVAFAETLTFGAAGLNVKPARVGVTRYDPDARFVKL